MKCKQRNDMVETKWVCSHVRYLVVLSHDCKTIQHHCPSGKFISKQNKTRTCRFAVTSVLFPCRNYALKTHYASRCWIFDLLGNIWVSFLLPENQKYSVKCYQTFNLLRKAKSALHFRALVNYMSMNSKAFN